MDKQLNKWIYITRKGLVSVGVRFLQAYEQVKFVLKKDCLELWFCSYV